MESEKTLEFTFEQKKHLAAPEQTAFVKAFKNYDLNKDGSMDEKEFKNIMIDLGFRKITDDKVKEMLASQDSNKDGLIQWVEFVDMMISIKEKDNDKFGTINADGIASITGEHGGKHSYSVEERITFAKTINHILKDDADLTDRIPMNIEDDTLFHVFDNGVALCKLLRQIDPECIDERAINKGESMNVYHI